MRKSILFLLIAIAVPLHAGEWGSRGVSRRFALNGNILYAADGRGVTVYDVSNPANIRRLDVETGDDETRDLALMGNTLFVATARGIDRFVIASDGTLTRGETSRELRDVTRIAANDRLIAAVTGETVTIFDADLTRIRTFKFADAVRAATFIGDVLYAGVEGIAIFAYDPETAIQLEVLPVDAADFALSGSTLWVAGPHGLVSLDVSAPAAPRILGNAGSGIWKLSSVAATATRVYAVELPDSVRVFDATTPQEPRLLTEMHEWVHTIAASGTRLFLSGSRIDAEGLPFETGLPVRIFDSLTLAGEYKDLAGPVSGAWTDGSIAFIVDPPYLRVLDVSKTAQPRELTSIVVPDIQDHIRVRDGMAILYGRSDVNFIDVSDPYKPKYLGTYDALGHPRSAAAFLRDTIVEANENSGLHIVDYSDPAKAHQISGRIWHYHDVAAGDDAVYVLQLANFLVLEITPDHRVIDRVNENILITQQVDTIPPSSGAPSHVVLRGVDAIELLTLENRFEPRELATIPMPRSELMGTSATSVFVSIDGRLSRIDVTDPETVIETEMRVSSPQQIAVAGEKLVIADRYSVRVYGPDTEPPAPSTVLRRRSTRH